MLTEILIENVKCFEKLHLPLAPLTLLTGTNATGKSTVLQSLALLHQTTVESEWSKTLILNASMLSLGTASDLIDQITGQREFKIGLQSEAWECLWTMEAQDRQSLSVPIRRIAWREKEHWENVMINVQENGERLRYLLPATILEKSIHAKQLATMLSGLTYISADRLGPRETYPLSTPDQHQTVGSRGELTPWFLYQFADKRPPEELILPDFPPTLQRQTEAWMKAFFPGTTLMLEPVKGANLITLGIRTHDATNFHRPQNVGYGLSYVLPIITACLGVNRGDVIMVENPEAHLHPSGQAAMGEFLAKSAAAGCQIIIETHSDHILNGIRRSIKKGILRHEQAAIHFFMPREEEHQEVSQVFSPLIDQNGNLDQWPAGFFDQFDQDTAFLIGWEE